MREASIIDVVLAGGSGGITYWAYTLLRGGQPAGELAQFDRLTWLWVSLPLTIVVGAAAAFLMVYFIAATNTKERMRAVGFAVACGLCWEPVLAGAIERFTQQYTDTQAEKNVAAAQQITPISTGTSASAAANVAADLVKNEPTVQNRVLKTEVQEQTNKLLQTIENTPDPDAKAEALQKVGVAAADAGSAVVLTQTVKSLENIADTEPQHAQRAREALNMINARVAARR